MKTNKTNKKLKLATILIAVVFGIATIPACTVEDTNNNDCNPACQNGGSCVDGQCDCPFGYSGASCETAEACVNPNFVCDYDGECVNGACECNTFSETYAVGSWDFDGPTVTLELTASQANFTGTGGVQSSNVSYSGDTIYLLDFNAYLVPTYVTLTCDSVILDEYQVGTNMFLNNYLLVRQ